jgi:hypothetical protein
LEILIRVRIELFEPALQTDKLSAWISLLFERLRPFQARLVVAGISENLTENWIVGHVAVSCVRDARSMLAGHVATGPPFRAHPDERHVP